MSHLDDMSIEELLVEVLEQGVGYAVDKWERKLTVGTAIAVGTGQIARLGGRKEVFRAYEDQDYEELQELQDETSEYVDTYLETAVTRSPKRALLYHHFPPKRAVEFWKNLGRAEGFTDLPYLEEDMFTTYNKEDVNPAHLYAEGYPEQE